MPEASGATGFMLCSYFTEYDAVAVDRSRGVHRECSWTLRNIGTKRRNQKFILALDVGFTDLAVILTVGIYGISLL
jgi:hypothetical protein